MTPKSAVFHLKRFSSFKPFDYRSLDLTVKFHTTYPTGRKKNAAECVGKPRGGNAEKKANAHQTHSKTVKSTTGNICRLDGFEGKLSHCHPERRSQDNITSSRHSGEEKHVSPPPSPLVRSFPERARCLARVNRCTDNCAGETSGTRARSSAHVPMRFNPVFTSPPPLTPSILSGGTCSKRINKDTNKIATWN